MVNKKKKKEKKEISIFEKNIDNFTYNVDSLIFSLPLIIEPLLKEYKNSRKELDVFFSAKKKSKNGKYIISFEEINIFNDIDNKYRNSSLALRTVPRSLFISLISYFDNHLKELLKIIYSKNQFLLSGTEKKISISEILDIPNHEDVKSYLINREIEQLLYESRFKCFDWIEDKVKVKFNFDESLKKSLIEITERRNLFVHSDGVITQQYINSCKKNNILISNKIKIGEQLSLSPEYFIRACSIILSIGVQLSQNLWRTLEKENIEGADISLLNLTASLIEKGNNFATGRLIEFIENLNKFSSEKLRLMLLINKAIAMKFGKNSKEAMKVINGHDWSAVDDDLKLAVSIIKDDYKKATEIMIKIGPTDEMKMAYKRDWPLFKEFRKTNLFKETYKKIFNESFILEDKNTNNENILEHEEK